jgi:hypothetical protein
MQMFGHAWASDGPCCTDQGYRRGYPSTAWRSGDADGDRASQLQHAVERMDGNVHLVRPTLVRARAQPVTDDLLEPADGLLDASPLRVVGCFLPPRAFMLGDALQVAVPLRGRGCGRLARHGRGPRRHDDRRFGMAPSDGGGDTILVVCAVGGERRHRPWHLVEQGADLNTVVDVFVGQRCCDDLPGAGIQADVRLRQDRRLLAPCFSTSHSPAPQSFRPVLSTGRCGGLPSLRTRGRGTSGVSARRLRIVWSGTERE